MTDTTVRTCQGCNQVQDVAKSGFCINCDPSSFDEREVYAAFKKQPNDTLREYLGDRIIETLDREAAKRKRLESKQNAERLSAIKATKLALAFLENESNAKVNETDYLAARDYLETAKRFVNNAYRLQEQERNS